MPDVNIESEALGRRTEDSEVKVTLDTLEDAHATWFLAEGETIEIAHDGPSVVSVEALDDDG